MNKCRRRKQRARRNVALATAARNRREAGKSVAFAMVYSGHVGPLGVQMPRGRMDSLSVADELGRLDEGAQ